jgi:hypothetical protein
MIAAVLTGYPQVMLALGEPGALMRFNLAVLALYAVAVGLVAPLGIVAVSVAVVFWHFVILVAVYRVLLRRHLDLPMRRLATDVGPALTCCCVLVAAALPVRVALVHAGVPAILVLAGAGAVAATAYCVALRVLFRGLWAELLTLAERVMPARRRPAPLAAAVESIPSSVS